MKKFPLLLVLILSLIFVGQEQAQALSIIHKSGAAFGSTTLISGNKAQTTLQQGAVKFVRHTKYTDNTQKKQESYKQLSGNFTRFVYTCPGYYMTRIYSDFEGKKQIGTIRIYVATSDLPSAPSSCAAVTPPPTPAPTPANPTPKPTPTPPAVEKVNTTHPNPLAVEPGNMIAEKFDYEAALEQMMLDFEGNTADPETSEYVNLYPEHIAPPPLEPYPFQNGHYDPLSDLGAFFPPPDPSWNIQNWDFSDPENTSYPLITVGNIGDGVYRDPEPINQDLEEDACVAAGGDIHYYEQYYDDAKDVNEDNTLCISHEEYNNCELVRYVATYRDGWSEQEDQNFENVAADLKQLLNFPSIYCKHLKNYMEPSYPYDPETTDNLMRASYEVAECADDSDACHELTADPFYTPSTAPVDPGEGGVVEPVDPGGGGSPRR